mmetsp:Transcript_39974/g.106974  ORF Transcript_39974/g.106974 Transcript_39974/m.106974 type:complete len:218 (-) Transcript_39974:274-927(-)
MPLLELLDVLAAQALLLLLPRQFLPEVRLALQQRVQLDLRLPARLLRPAQLVVELHHLLAVGLLELFDLPLAPLARLPLHLEQLAETVQLIAVLRAVRQRCPELKAKLVDLILLHAGGRKRLEILRGASHQLGFKLVHFPALSTLKGQFHESALLSEDEAANNRSGLSDNLTVVNGDNNIADLNQPISLRRSTADNRLHVDISITFLLEENSDTSLN